MTISGRRKLTRKDVYIEIEPELIDLSEVLEELQLTREQLIDIAILLGTDYNPGGVKGIGPKKALKIVKAYGCLEKAIEALPELKELRDLPIPVEEIRRLFLEPDVTEDYKLEWRNMDPEAVKRVLCDEHDFSEERVQNAIERVVKAQRAQQQMSLDAWFR